jgi:hypothetical protein
MISLVAAALIHAGGHGLDPKRVSVCTERRLYAVASGNVVDVIMAVAAFAKIDVIFDQTIFAKSPPSQGVGGYYTAQEALEAALGTQADAFDTWRSSPCEYYYKPVYRAGAQ